MPPKATTAKLVVVDKPGVNQTALRVGRVAAARATPDFYALQLLNEILGGAYTSRLMANIREEKGYAYGAFSRFDFGRAPGPFAVVTSVRSDATAPAVKEIDHELARLIEKAPAASEFAQARDSLVRSLPGAFETNAGISGAFANLFTYQLPLEYYAKLPDHLMHVRLGAIKQAARRYLDPGSMVVVAVGEQASIEPPLESAGIKPVQTFAPADLF